MKYLLAVIVAFYASLGSANYVPLNLALQIDFDDYTVYEYEPQSDLLIQQGAPGWSSIYYENGTYADRKAQVVKDPSKAYNQDKALHLWLKNATIYSTPTTEKGRIQLGWSNLQIPNLFHRFSMYLHPDMEYYRQHPDEHTFLILGEYWMGEPWLGHPYPNRITIYLAKPAGVNSGLYLYVVSSHYVGGDPKNGQFEGSWYEFIPLNLPTGMWIDYEIGLRSGDESDGKIYIGIKLPTQVEYTPVLDVTRRTYHPDSPTVVPVTTWQPLKLYSGEKMIDHIRDSGGVMQVYYDDFEVFLDWSQ